MSGTLAVTVECGFFGEGQHGVLTHVVGNIYAAARDGRSQRQVALPLGWDPEPARFELPAGHYLVEAALPSGQVLTDDVQVPEGGTATAQLRMEGSPFESHMLQYAIGNIEPARVYHSPETYPVPNSRGSRSFSLAPEVVGKSPPPAPEVVALSPERRRWLPIRQLNNLAQLPPTQAARAVADLAGNNAPPPLLPHETMPQSPLFRIDERMQDLFGVLVRPVPAGVLREPGLSGGAALPLARLRWPHHSG